MIGLAAGVLGLAVIAVAYRAGRNLDQPALLSFHRLTFGRGTVLSARFAPEGGTIAYSAAWDGKAVDLFSTRPDSSESRSWHPDADVLAGRRPAMALLVAGLGPEWGVEAGNPRASVAG
jgi:hypothetical protein